ncbi:MAG TPA: EamA family transporter [Propionicimonas sp.]|nr:EamA family transporter [Propionicimonas sp.]
MWIAFAFASALFAGLTAILAKVGVRHTDSNLATAIRTTVVLAAAWLMVLLVGSASQLVNLSGSTVGFLVASGLATGGSWLCYFKALQLGEVNKVAPIDRLSIVLTVLLAMIFLGEVEHLATRLPGIALIGVGTWLMVRRPAAELDTAATPALAGPGWFVYALGAAVFAALTAVLGKVGISGVESNLGTAIRTTVVLVLAWGIVLATGRKTPRPPVPRRDLTYIGLSGLATGASWLCYFKALQDGPASVVAPIDKLSIVVTVLLAGWLLGERLTRRGWAGLAVIVAGTGLMLL